MPSEDANGRDATIDIRSRVFSSYTSIRDLMIDKKNNVSLNLPRLCLCGEQSTGKSSLVEQFIGFPCSLTKTGVGTRCPVSYVLKENVELTEPKVTKPALTNKSQLVQTISDHMEKVSKLNPPFTSTPFEVIIEGPGYHDMEILDLPGFWTLDVNPNNINNQARRNSHPQDANDADVGVSGSEIEKIAQFYLRDPNYLIVLLLFAHRDGETATGLSIVKRLCTGLDHAVVPARPPRDDWRSSILYVGNFFGLFADFNKTAVAANRELAARDARYGMNNYNQPNIVYTCLKGDPNAMEISTYAQKEVHIKMVPEKEREMFRNWRERMDQYDNTVQFNPNFAYDTRIGIGVVKQRIYNLWFRSFISKLPELHEKLCERANILIKESRTLHSELTSEEKQSKITSAMYLYVEDYVTQMQELYLRTDRIYDATLQTWEEEMKYCPIVIPEPCKLWERQFQPATIKHRLSHTNYDAFKQTLCAPMTGEAQLERLIQCWQFLVLIYQPTQITVEEVTADLRSSAYNGTPNLTLVIQKRISKDITIAFASSWIWLT